MLDLTHIKNQKQKNTVTKNGITLDKLMNNAAYDKRMENLRIIIDVKNINNKKVI